MTDDVQEGVRAALAGDPRVVRALVAQLTPVIRASAARSLLRRRAFARGADIRQLLDDVTQDVFVELFRNDGKLLRTWDPARGMGLPGFVGLVAEQRVGAMLRSRRKNPWFEELANDGAPVEEPPHPAEPDGGLASRQALERLFERAQAELSPLGHELLRRLILEEEPIASVAAAMGMSTSAVQAWSSRLKRLLVKLWAEVAKDPTAQKAGSGA